MVISRSKSKWAPASLIPPLVSHIELHICPYLNRMHLYKQCHEQLFKPGFLILITLIHVTMSVYWVLNTVQYMNASKDSLNAWPHPHRRLARIAFAPPLDPRVIPPSRESIGRDLLLGSKTYCANKYALPG